MKYQNIAVLSFLLFLGLSVYFFLVQPMTHPARASVDGRTISPSEYGVEKPVNGVLKGVIEIGSTGFNSFVIHVDKQKRWEMLAKNFGVSLVYEGMATPESMRQGIQRYMSSMFDNAVQQKDVHIVISSAAQKTPKAWEMMNELTKMGHRIVAVSAAEEAKYGFLATVPASMRGSSFFVDVGSGNTKIAWQEGDSIRSCEAPGSKDFGI